MTEMTKTGLFLALAVGAVLLAYFTRPSTREFNIDEMRGQPLFSDLESDEAKRLRITTMNSETGESRVFEVTERDGVWTIPSKSGYPADATQQMGEAVEGLSGREILSVVTNDSGQHAEFGVADPVDSTARAGHGTRVQLFDDKDKVLADLIIGKEDSSGNYYVRHGGKDPVYLAQIDLENFSTDFHDWIEKDLLDLNPMDVEGVTIDDYSLEIVETREGLAAREERRARMVLSYDESAGTWNPVTLEQFDPEKGARGEYVPFELGPDEKLNEDALRELKNALDDLLIVDVERKPEGLSADLQAGEDFMNDEEAKRSLFVRGFTPIGDGTGRVQLYASEGEIVCTLKNGIEYVLRFGDLHLLGDDQGAEPPEGEEEAAGLNRYLFVMARFNEEAIEKPQLEPLPELPAEGSEATDTASGDAAEPATEGEESSEAADGEADGEGDAAEGAAGEDAPPQDEAAQTRAEIEKQRETVKQANEQREKEYQEKLEQGRKEVERLNARFGDWFYVISNDVFKKIHLGRDQVIKEKSSEEAPSEGEAASPLSGLPDFGLGTEPEDPADEPAMEEGTSPAPGEEASEGSEEEALEEAPAPQEGASEEPAAPATEAAETPAAEPAPPDEASQEPATEEPAAETPAPEASAA